MTSPNPLSAALAGQENPLSAALKNQNQTQQTADRSLLPEQEDGSDFSLHNPKAEENPLSAALKEDKNPLSAALDQDKIEKKSEPPSYMDQPWYQKVWDKANQPLLDLKKLDPESTGFKAGIEDVVSSLTSPISLALWLGTAGLGPTLEAVGIAAPRLLPAAKLLRSVVTTGFTVTQAIQLVQTSSQFLDALNDGDADRMKELSVQAAAGLAGVAVAAREIGERSILPKKLGKLLTAQEKTEQVQQIGNSYNRDRAISKAQSDRLVEALNNKLSSLPEAEKGAVLLRIEHPEQASIEAARNYVNASAESMDKYKERYKQAAQLSQEHLDFIKNEVKNETRENFDLAEKNGISKKFLDDYITHVWKPVEKGTPDNFGVDKQNLRAGKLDTQVSMARERVFNKFVDGISLGRELQTEDPIALIGWQRHTIQQAIAARHAVQSLRSLDLVAEDGRPAAMLSGLGRTVGDDSSKAILVDQAAMRDRHIPVEYVKKQLGGEGSHLMNQLIDKGVIEKTKTGYVYTDNGYVDIDHPAFKEWQWAHTTDDGQPILMKSSVRIHPQMVDQVKNMFGLDESAIRNSAVGKAALGASSIGKSLVFFTNPGHFVQAAARSIMSGTSPFAREGFGVEDPEVGKLIQYGLGFMSHDDSLHTFESNAMEGPSSVANKIPVLGKANQWLHEKLWNYVNNVKQQAAVDLARRYREANPTWDENQIYTKAADDANNRFGIQNMSQLGVNKTWKDAMQLSMLAPDWFLSEIRSMGSLFQPGNKIMAQDMARMSAYMIVAARVANLAISGKARWDHPFGVVLPGDDKKSDQVFSFRSLPGDLAHFASDPRGALSNRLNPTTVNVLLRAFTGRDKNGKPLNGPEQINALVNGIAPMWLQPALNNQNVPDDAKTKLLKSVISMGGIQDYPARTAAEKLAMQASYGNAGSSDPDEIQKHVIRMRVLDGMKAGSITLPQAVKAVGYTQAIKMQGELRNTPLQAHFTHLNLKQALEVWNLADTKEKNSLKRQMMLKRVQWLEKTPMSERQGTKEWEGLKRAFPDLN